eukprot:gene5251-3762_t
MLQKLKPLSSNSFPMTIHSRPLKLEVPTLTKNTLQSETMPFLLTYHFTHFFSALFAIWVSLDILSSKQVLFILI